MEISPAANVPVGYRSSFVKNAKGLQETDLLRAIYTEKTQPGGFMNMNDQSLNNPSETSLSWNFGKHKAAKKVSFAAW